MLELVGVRHRYGGRVVLDLERFEVPPGALIAMVGPNGSGKSTLLRLLALLEQPTEGEVRLDGRPVSGGPARASPNAAARQRVTLVEQRPMLLRGTVRANLGYGLRVRGMRRTEVNRVTEDVAARLGVTPLLERHRHELSEGEVQRVAVARALAVDPAVLLLDEPVSSADRAAAQTLYGALAQGKLSPVTPENLFRVDLPNTGAGDLKHIRVGTIEIAAMTDRAGPAILAVAPSDIFVSRAPLTSSARNVFAGRVTRLARQRPGAVHVTADVGVELIAVVTEEAARDLQLAPGSPVAFAFKASAVRVF